MHVPLCHPQAERIVITCLGCKRQTEMPVTDALRRMDRYAFEKALRCSQCGRDWPHVDVLPQERSRWDRR